MTAALRSIDAGAMDAPVAFGRMPILAASVVAGGAPVLMTGMFGAAHFQIGWFEDVDAVIDLDEARARRIDVFRRPVWGGGTAFYDTNASAIVAFFMPDDAFASLDAALERFTPVMRRALDEVGLAEARFEGASDLRWNGRKLGTLIAQSVLGTKVVGGFFNLRAPDLETYAAVARVPEEKFKDKVIKDQVAYICTPRDVRGSDLAYEELREAVTSAARAAGIPLTSDRFTADEERGTQGFADAVSSDDHVRRVSGARFLDRNPTAAFANLKAKKLVRAGVALGADGRIEAAMMAGDMHVSPPDVMDRVAAALEGASPADENDLRARVAAVLEAPDVSQPDAAAGITAEDCARVVAMAAARARKSAAAEP